MLQLIEFESDSIHSDISAQEYQKRNNAEGYLSVPAKYCLPRGLDPDNLHHRHFVPVLAASGTARSGSMISPTGVGRPDSESGVHRVLQGAGGVRFDPGHGGHQRASDPEAKVSCVDRLHQELTEKLLSERRPSATRATEG
jgi:hypothetical protein